ncbi:hypothetical protein OV079_16075 [Nannocystis pusilla]|uniref:Peptidase M41 domain-containing protein n=1 Tax=Nannocystis pusilla TaxID=889268 RepID=A0A9X3IW74_9BACT|nr:hypothetical protein [Nannocystis pusilla]MCY1007047.1 hypothetical protein [Nannocystis pusilla]
MSPWKAALRQLRETMDPRSPETRREHALHEAAHFVAFTILADTFPKELNFRIVHISICPGDGSDGELYCKYEDSLPLPQSAVLVLLAGIAAQVHARHVGGLADCILIAKDVGRKSGRYDIEMIYEHFKERLWSADDCPGESSIEGFSERLLEAHFESALELVKVNWARVLRVADALLEKWDWTLTPDEALEAYKEADEGSCG